MLLLKPASDADHTQADSRRIALRGLTGGDMNASDVERAVRAAVDAALVGADARDEVSEKQGRNVQIDGLNVHVSIHVTAQRMVLNNSE